MFALKPAFFYCSLSRKVPYFLLGITALLSMNILLLLQQQPNSEGLPLVQTEFLDSRKLRQYVEPSADRDRTFPVRLPQNGMGDGRRATPRMVRVEPDPITAAVERLADPAPAEVKPEAKVAAPAAPAESHVEPVKPAVNEPAAAPAAPAVEVKPPTAKAPVKAVPPKASVKIDKPIVYGKSPRNTLQPLQPGSYITPNEILQRTAVAIKTFNRAECLMTTVASFKQSYPDIPVFVADDSFEDTVSKNLTQEYEVTYIRLPVDSGVGYGRNRLIEHIHKLGKCCSGFTLQMWQ